MSGRLVLYFSVYGTAKRVAEEIAFQSGADLLAIEPAVPYDNDRSHYIDLARRAKLEHDMQLRPIIQNTLSIAPYDEIFLPGTVARVEPNVMHWHGSAGGWFQHIAVETNPQWTGFSVGDKVTDEIYEAAVTLAAQLAAGR